MKKALAKFRSAPFLATLAILTVALLIGAPFDSDAVSLGLGALGALPAVGLAVGDAAQAAPRQRIREDLPAFQNVVATGRASCEIPRYALTMLRANLRLGGTSFTKAMISEVRLKIGSKVVWFVTGSHLDAINKYKPLAGIQSFDDPAQLAVDFTQPRFKSRAEYLGGIDMSKMPDGKLMLEVLIAGATAPTLAGKVTWGPVQGNNIIAKLLQYTFSSGTATGRQSVPLVFNGAMVQRLFIFYTGNDWVQQTATSAAWSSNTGNGAMGAITASFGAKPGVYKLRVVEPAANAGTFTISDPDGVDISVKGQVASAFSGGGLAFTLADGGTDFLAGDGFDITVSPVVNGNVNRVEVKKDGRVVWDYECADARFLQKEFQHFPQARCYVVDFVADNRPDGVLTTADAKALEFGIWLTAADNLTIYAEVLDTPENN